MFNHPLKTKMIMLQVILATLPGLFVISYIFGFGIIQNIIYAIFMSQILEATCLYYREKPIFNGLNDYSALVTAILLAACLPASFSVFKIFIGLFFAIVVAKHLYGGLGHNIFNPAMVGYVVLLIAFPTDFTHWPVAHYIFPEQDLISMTDDISQATPLDPIVSYNFYHLKEFYLMNTAWLIGGIYLLIRKIIPISLPFSFLLGLFITAAITYGMDNTGYYPQQHLFLGATMIGAFFIVTDPISAPVSISGRWIYGLLVGIICYLIRAFGKYPDGLAFAILFMNTWVPLINKITIKKPKLNV